jgi:uncharacterized protein
MVENDGIDESPVSWTIDEMNVNATLTHPEGEGPFPAVIMVAGSGPTDRDWNTPLIPGANGSAALLAAEISENGFVTLRYDKRASGPQAKENMTHLAGKVSMQSHLDELAGGMRLLADQWEVDSDHIFILSNSEGAFHALNYQTQGNQPAAAGLVLTSAPARPAGALAHEQVAAQLTSVPGGDKLLAAYDAAIEDFIAGRPVKVDESLPEGLRMLIAAASAPMNQPFARELWTTDPAKLLEKVEVPVLILLGKKDIQVSWQNDGAIFAAIAEKRENIQIAYLENANHVLKYEPKPRSSLTVEEVMATYNADSSRLDDEAVEMIIAWLKSQV